MDSKRNSYSQGSEESKKDPESLATIMRGKLILWSDGSRSYDTRREQLYTAFQMRRNTLTSQFEAAQHQPMELEDGTPLNTEDNKFQTEAIRSEIEILNILSDLIDALTKEDKTRSNVISKNSNVTLRNCIFDSLHAMIDDPFDLEKNISILKMQLDYLKENNSALKETTLVKGHCDQALRELRKKNVTTRNVEDDEAPKRVSLSDLGKNQLARKRSSKDFYIFPTPSHVKLKTDDFDKRKENILTMETKNINEIYQLSRDLFNIEKYIHSEIEGRHRLSEGLKDKYNKFLMSTHLLKIFFMIQTAKQWMITNFIKSLLFGKKKLIDASANTTIHDRIFRSLENLLKNPDSAISILSSLEISVGHLKRDDKWLRQRMPLLQKLTHKPVKTKHINDIKIQIKKALDEFCTLEINEDTFNFAEKYRDKLISRIEEIQQNNKELNHWQEITCQQLEDRIKILELLCDLKNQTGNDFSRFDLASHLSQMQADAAVLDFPNYISNYLDDFVEYQKSLLSFREEYSALVGKVKISSSTSTSPQSSISEEAPGSSSPRNYHPNFSFSSGHPLQNPVDHSKMPSKITPPKK